MNLPELKRDIDRWRKCDPAAMAHKQSPAAIQFAFEDARADILALHAYATQCATLAAERAAKIALAHTTHADDPANEVWQSAYNHVANEIAAAIRAQGEPAHGPVYSNASNGQMADPASGVQSEFAPVWPAAQLTKGD